MSKIQSMDVVNFQQWEAVWPQCVVRAWQDPEFREALKRDPAGTLCAHYQFPVPPEVDLQVIESGEEGQARSAQALRMVIPPAPELEAHAVALIDSAGMSMHGGPRPPFSCLC